MKTPVYLIIETGYEGIEQLCYLTDSREEAVAYKAKAIEEKRREQEEIAEMLRKEGLDPHEGSRDVADFFCIQKWDGKEFSCACGDLGVAPSKPMFR